MPEIRTRAVKKFITARRIRIIFALISLAITIAAFFRINSFLNLWLQLQAGPQIIKLFTLFTISGLSFLLVLIASAFVFGRFYCSVICPFGILQDVILFITRKRTKIKAANFKKTRYLIAAVTLAFMTAGWSLFFKLLDPYSVFGSIDLTLINPAVTYIHNFLFPSSFISAAKLSPQQVFFGGLLPLLLITALVIWKRRIFCTAICPVGTLLGLCAKNSVLKLEIDCESCIACGKCMKACPADCINIASKILDNERCVRCLNCISVCPVNAAVFRRNKNTGSFTNTANINTGRRNFLIGTVLTFCSLGISAIAKPGGVLRKDANDETAILPPGAGSAQRFNSLCTACLLCVGNCRGKVLKAGGFARKGVHLNFDNGFCEHSCNNCSTVCPTGAISKLKLKDKNLTKIGTASLMLYKCITVAEGTECGACAEQCPTGALQMMQQGDVRVPEFNAEICIGCGACENVCPAVPEKALKIMPVKVQYIAEKPEDYFNRNPKRSANYKEETVKKKSESSADNGGWLL